MHRKHSTFYYIFWIFIPVVIGIFLAWGAFQGIKTAYVGLRGENKFFSHYSSSNKVLVTKEEENIGSDDEEEKPKDIRVRSPIFYSEYQSEETIIEENIRDSSFITKVENSLPKKPILKKITALAYVAADLDSGEILVEKNKDKILPIASITKLITALVSLNTLDQDAVITVSKKAVDTYGTAGGLFAGEKMRTEDLLFPLLLESSNDAAEALAQSKNRTNFLKSMNQTASLAGASHTSFLDASGLSFHNVSTPLDMFKIAQYIYKNKKIIFEITSKKSYTLGKHIWKNPTYFLRLNAYIGGKNGYTDEAGRTAVSLFNIPQENRPARNVAVVVLKSSDRNADVASIVNYLAEVESQEFIGSIMGEDIEMEFY